MKCVFVIIWMSRYHRHKHMTLDSLGQIITVADTPSPMPS